MQILVSVHMVTFNHVKYIKEAIEGVLMQQTNFNIELIIGDDFSTDGTREICQEYYAKYPDKIKLLLHDRNLGGGGKFNSMAVLSACQGKYIALCEGDDYWTYPYKLQKQVDFLESNPDFTICHHNVKILEQSGAFIPYYNQFPLDVSSLNELSKTNYIATLSVVFRNPNCSLPDFFKLSPVGDYMLYFILLQPGGKIKYFEESMGIYRRSSTGIWSSLKAREQQIKWIFCIDMILNNILLEENVTNNLLNQIINSMMEISNSQGDINFSKELQNNLIIPHVIKSLIEEQNRYRILLSAPDLLSKSIAFKNLIKAVIIKLVNKVK
jgi:glycosyltransferase involved in cell wall biosynthesis